MFYYISVSWIVSRIVSFLYSYWPGKCNLRFGPSSNISAMLYEASEQV